MLCNGEFEAARGEASTGECQRTKNEQRDGISAGVQNAKNIGECIAKHRGDKRKQGGRLSEQQPPYTARFLRSRLPGGIGDMRHS